MFDTIDFSHRMRVVRAQLQRSARSSRQVKLVEASVKGPTVLRNAGFYGGVVAAYVFTEKMAGGILMAWPANGFNVFRTSNTLPSPRGDESRAAMTSGCETYW